MLTDQRIAIVRAYSFNSTKTKQNINQLTMIAFTVLTIDIAITIGVTLGKYQTFMKLAWSDFIQEVIFLIKLNLLELVEETNYLFQRLF